MMLLLTTDLNVREEITQLNFNGYSAANTPNGIKVMREDILSIQYAYGPDFIYNYIDMVKIGFSNSSGTAPVFHQEIPIEIIKHYHSVMASPEICELNKRAVRNDVFTIGHHPYKQFGSFSFAMKDSSSLPENT
jgi:hypothetical protein